MSEGACRNRKPEACSGATKRVTKGFLAVLASAGVSGGKERR